MPGAAAPAASTPPARLDVARSRVLRHGWNTTAYQILNPGIALWFDDAHDAVAGYVDAPGVRVVAGAPVCARDDLAAVAAQFEQDAARAGRCTCYFGAEGRLESLNVDSSTHAMITLGAQPVWRPAVLANIIATRASLRAQINRGHNKGVTVTLWDSHRAEESADLRRCLQQWLATRGLPSLHFLVEPNTLHYLSDRLVFVAERRGAPVAFLVASPIPARRGWLVEQFVRGTGAPNGTAELMIDAAARQMAELGSEYVTLGLAPLSQRAGIHGSPEPWWLRALFVWTRAHGRRFYNFDGLDAFKAKFQPESWDPVFAIANQPEFSIRALYAIASAFTSGHPVSTVMRGMGKALMQELHWAQKRARYTDARH